MAQYVANFAQTGEQIVIGLVNNDNGTSFTAAQIIFGDVADAATEDAPTRTALELTAASGSGYTGSATVHYKRVALSFMADLAPELKIVTDELRSTDLIDFLNEKFGVALTAADIVDEALPEQAFDVDTVYSLKAAALSKVFAGEVELTLNLPSEALADVLLVTELDGLYAPTELPAAEEQPAP